MSIVANAIFSSPTPSSVSRTIAPAPDRNQAVAAPRDGAFRAMPSDRIDDGIFNKSPLQNETDAAQRKNGTFPPETGEGKDASDAAKGRKSVDVREKVKYESKIGFVEGTLAPFIDIVDPRYQQRIARVFGPADVPKNASEARSAEMPSRDAALQKAPSRKEPVEEDPRSGIAAFPMPAIVRKAYENSLGIVSGKDLQTA
ncbi:MAG: hypothetical protein ING19_08950 [Azospirillum sp.]|nr:hypothetical protein [Azospirillum sp.]